MREDKNMAKIEESKIIINVYDDDDKIIKTSEAQMVDLKFKTVRSLIELLNVENVDDTGALMKMIYSAWDSVMAILGKVFPDLSADDWDNVKVSELIPTVLKIIKGSFSYMLKVPTEKN
jgi:hypothetical protein